MSRVGKLAITVPSDVKVDINDSAGSITITGKLGTLTYNGLQSVIYTYENNNLVGIITYGNTTLIAWSMLGKQQIMNLIV